MLRHALAALLVLAGVARAGAAPVVAVDAIGFTVADLDREVRFFTEVLDFQKVSEVEVHGDAYEHLTGVFGMRARVARLRLGDETIELTEYLAPRGRPIPPGGRSNDRAFQHVAIVVRDMAQAYARLRQHHVEHASTGPQKLPDWNPNAGGIEAFYFKDPEGHVLEVIAFPPDRGAAKWKAPTEKLFLGIDHTAIVVSDTAASLRFWRDLLGLTVAGESLNHGTEQEHLNNVFGARLRITGLRAQAGPGVEFLEYLAPRDGREAPRDQHANDLQHWQTHLVTRDVDAAAQAAFAARVDFVSSGAVALPDDTLGFRKGALVRDPDGHTAELVQR